MSGIDFLYQENLDCEEPQISQPRDKNITSGEIERKATKALIMSAVNLVADDLGCESYNKRREENKRTETSCTAEFLVC